MPETDAPVANDESESQEKEDHKRNYHCARLAYGLLVLHLDDAVREGDASRLLDFLKVALLLLHCHHRVKYACVVLLFLAKIYAILPKGIALEVLHNRVFNSVGKAGGIFLWISGWSILTKLLKLALKQLGVNVTETGAQRIAKSLEAVEDILLNVDRDCNRKKRSGYHSSKCLEETTVAITKDLKDEQVFNCQLRRAHLSLRTSI